MKLTVWTLTYNEAVQLPVFVAHYRERFPDCHIVVWDNESTDDTVRIAQELGCEVRSWHTNGTLQDSRMLEIKSNCWKESLTDWNCVCDVDELCDINQWHLAMEDAAGTSHIEFQGWNMINMSEDPADLNPWNLEWGVRDTNYDKVCFINRTRVRDIGWNHGCHKSNPKGEILHSQGRYPLYHNKYPGLNWLIERYAVLAERMSQENLNNRWATHYLEKAESITAQYRTVQSTAQKIR